MTIKGAVFWSPDGSSEVGMSTVSCVNDNNNCNHLTSKSIEDILQNNAQEWERLLHASGGN